MLACNVYIQYIYQQIISYINCTIITAYVQNTVCIILYNQIEHAKVTIIILTTVVETAATDTYKINY